MEDTLTSPQKGWSQKTGYQICCPKRRFVSSIIKPMLQITRHALLWVKWISKYAKRTNLDQCFKCNSKGRLLLAYRFIEFSKTCQVCEYYGKFIRQPPEPLHVIARLWPFTAWGIDMVGHNPRVKNILATMDYSSKWVEAIPVRDFTTLTWWTSSRSTPYIDLAFSKHRGR